MEHRGDRHVDVVRAEADGVGEAAERRHAVQGVQHDLPMRKEHALRVPGGAGGVEGGGHRALVEGGELEPVRRRLEHRLVVPVDPGARGRCLPLADHDHLPHRLEIQVNLVEDRQEVLVDDQDPVLRVIQRVEDLLGGEPDVDRVQHRTHHRNGEVRLEVAVAVELHRGHDVAGGDPQAAEPVREPADPLVQRAVGDAGAVAVDDLALGGVRERRAEQLLQDQGVRIGLSRSVRLLRHDASFGWT